jgi:hypothetical protein
MEIRSGAEPYRPNSMIEPAQQVREAPPRHRCNRSILHAPEQQQQSEDRLDVDSDKEQRVDVEIHRAPPVRRRSGSDG